MHTDTTVAGTAQNIHNESEMFSSAKCEFLQHVNFLIFFSKFILAKQWAIKHKSFFSFLIGNFIVPLMWRIIFRIILTKDNIQSLNYFLYLQGMRSIRVRKSRVFLINIILSMKTQKSFFLQVQATQLIRDFHWAGYTGKKSFMYLIYQ